MGTHSYERRNGKPVKTYAVVWREPARDQFGLPIPVNPEHPDGPKRMIALCQFSAFDSAWPKFKPWTRMKFSSGRFGYGGEVVAEGRPGRLSSRTYFTASSWPTS